VSTEQRENLEAILRQSTFPFDSDVSEQRRLLREFASAQPLPADVTVTAAVLGAVDPIPFYMAAGENAWAGVKANLDTVTERAAAPIVAKYTGVLAAADIEVFTYTTTFQIMQSLRLDTGLGVSRPVNP
jgi:hypothetical protein